jgi:hypothetical protein
MYSPFAGCGMLQLAVHIIEETSPLPNFASRVFKAAIVPLIASPNLHLLHAEITSLTAFFLEDNPIRATYPSHVIVRCFARSLAGNQSHMIGITATVLAYMPVRTMATWAVHIVRLLAQATDSLSEAVAGAAAGIWSKPGGVRFLTEQKKLITPIMVPAVYRAMSAHWSDAVRDMAKGAMLSFQKTEPMLTQAALKDEPVNSTTYLSWMAIARRARASDGGMALEDKLRELVHIFEPGAPSKKSIRTGG